MVGGSERTSRTQACGREEWSPLDGCKRLNSGLEKKMIKKKKTGDAGVMGG